MKFCHECLAENLDSAARCAECGAKLHVVGKSFAEEFQENALVATKRVYGLVIGAVASGIYGVACAALFPEFISRKIVFMASLGVVFLVAQFCGRLLADALNDTSLT